MAKNPKRRQKTQQRKQRKREQAKKRARRQASPTSVLLETMRHAADAPLRDCLINRDWQGYAARVVVSRNSAHGIAVAFFLVDRGCRGVTDVFCRSGLDEDEYDSFIEGVESMEPFKDCSPDLAAKVVLAANFFGATFGFAPPKDFREAWQLLRAADPGACADDVTCGGADGRPVFAPAIDEDPEPVLCKLTARLGPDGFDYLPPPEAPDASDWLDGESMPAVRCDDDELPADFAWRRLRVAESKLTDQVIAYGERILGLEMLDEAWFEFDMASGKPRLLPDDPLYPTWFLPWVAFTWIPHDFEDDFDDGLEDLPNREEWPERPLALELLDAEGDRLDAFERRFLETACARPYSFYRIAGIEPGQALELIDMFTGRRWRVNERAATECVQPDGILFTRIVPIDDHAIMVGGGPYEIPPGYAFAILNLRDKIRGERDDVVDDDLHDWVYEVRDLHTEITRAQASPVLPELSNTDGDPLVPTELRFRLDCAPDEAFQVLRGLAAGWSEDELLEGAGRDDGGALRSVTVDWCRGGNEATPGAGGTILGRLEIDGARLDVDVNSERRAKRIRGEIEKRLGKRVVFEHAVIHSIEKMLEDFKREGPPAGGRTDVEREALEQEPEVREAVERMMEQRWRAWPDEKIPALGDRTPREAAQTPDGRERLDALLREYAWNDERQPNPSLRAPIDRLRGELGLS